MENNQIGGNFNSNKTALLWIAVGVLAIVAISLAVVVWLKSQEQVFIPVANQQQESLPQTSIPITNQQQKSSSQEDIARKVEEAKQCVSSCIAKGLKTGMGCMQECVTDEAVSVALLNEQRALSRDARRVADIKQLQLALEMYYDANNGKYSAALSSLAPDFIPVVPIDPSTRSAYRYCASSNGSSYHLGAVLEDASHPVLSSDADWATDGCVSGSFNGKSVACAGASAASTDLCFDVKP